MSLPNNDYERMRLARKEYDNLYLTEDVTISKSMEERIPSESYPKNQQQINRGTILHHHRQIHATHSLHQRKKQSKRTNNPLQRFYRTG